MDLACTYLEFCQEVSREIQFSRFETPYGGKLIETPELKTRDSPSVSCIVYKLFKDDPFATFSWTQCAWVATDLRVSQCDSDSFNNSTVLCEQRK